MYVCNEWCVGNRLSSTDAIDDFTLIANMALIGCSEWRYRAIAVTCCTLIASRSDIPVRSGRGEAGCGPSESDEEGGCGEVVTDLV